MKILIDNKTDLVLLASDGLHYDGDRLCNGKTKYAKDPTQDVSIVEVETLPEDFIPNCYTYTGGVFTATDELAVRKAEEEAREQEELIAKKQALLLSEILALENQVTQRRLREAVLTEEGKAWLENIEQQIDDLRAEGESKGYI